MSNKTRHSLRAKNFSRNMRIVDNETRQYVVNAKIDELQSDFYDSPNRLAEDKSDEQDFELEEKEEGQKPKKLNRKIAKRAKQECSLRNKLNLKKLIKEQNIDESKFPNFVNIRADKNKVPARSFCNVCGVLSKYSCPRCGQKYCSIRCHNTHQEVFCLKFDI